MYADPAVVRKKVEREIAAYFERQDHYRSRGIWVLQYRFPELLVAFVAPNSKPYSITPYCVLFELSNYDVEPPSIRFVNPFTMAPLKKGEIPTTLTRLRLHANSQSGPAGQVEQVPQPQRPGVVSDDLLQGWSPDDDQAFVCLQGVREYHENPAHTGDPWWLYRGKGAGSLLRVLDILSKYGTEAMRELNFQLRFEPAGIQAQLLVEPS
jgi:hypothetical protein